MFLFVFLFVGRDFFSKGEVDKVFRIVCGYLVSVVEMLVILFLFFRCDRKIDL